MMIIKKSLISLSLVVISSIAFANGGKGHQVDHDFGDRGWGHHPDQCFSFSIMGIYDKDKNHYLDEKELSSYIDSAKEYALLQDKSIQKFEDLDQNKDTFVSFDEFLKLKPTEFKPEFVLMNHHRPNHLEHFDYGPSFSNDERMKNNDNDIEGIDKDELKQRHDFFEDDFGKMLKNEFDFKRFNFQDKNHDGKLSAKEYDLFYQKQVSDLAIFKSFVDGLSLKNLDINGDGMINSKEIKYYRDGLLIKNDSAYNSKK